MPVEVSHRSGMRAFTFDRCSAVIAWVCANVPLVTQTKLYKLLFYSDFLGYRSSGRSLTGVAYCRMPYGPVPAGFSVLRAALEEREVVSVEEVTFQNGNTGEVFRVGPRGERAADSLEPDDLVVLRFVRDTLGGLPPSAISDRSHEETAWKETPPKAMIDYEHARAVDHAAGGVVSDCFARTPCLPQTPPPHSEPRGSSKVLAARVRGVGTAAADVS
ncbi:MAG: Panacea domain-containing protein [Planctomycetota bacterium]|nr:Panacea domain-containing protein [Planctomycetota bacterium]